MDSNKSNKSNKIRDIVRLQQILKKWKKVANAPKNSSNSISSATSTTSSSSSSSTTSNGSKSIKFILKRTLSFSDVSGASNNHVVPKGFLAVCVGKELKRFIIPTQYLGHQAFAMLLREAEEEFGFQQEGVLKIPCQVSVFEKILKVVEEKRSEAELHLHDQLGFDADKEKIGCYSPDHCELTPSNHPQMCR